MASFMSSGDLGDICYMLPVLKAIGGKHVIRLADRTKVAPYSQPIVRRAHLLIPLLESQEYIEKAECSEEKPDVDMSKFRVYHRPTTTLTSAQCDYYTATTGHSIGAVGIEPWLTGITPSERTKGRVLISRSPRYHNFNFPWKEIYEFYGDKLLYVGLPVEHMVWQTRFGPVEHLKTENFLQLAQYISGADLFIGNQSSPMSVALGLGGDIIQETCVEQPDCIFARDNVQYVTDGTVQLTDYSGAKEPLKVAGKPKKNHIDTSLFVEVPPGCWQYPGLPPMSHLKAQTTLVQKLEDCSEHEAKEKLVLFNIRRVPEFFQSKSQDPFSTVEVALNNARLAKSSKTL